MRHTRGESGRGRCGDPAEAGRGRRPFDYGALRLIVLGMIAEAPRHGYEIIKAIAGRMDGAYSPSPGAIYPTLAWLEDMGFVVPEAEGGRKRYRITPEGAALLAANRTALAGIEARMRGQKGRRDAPEPVARAMDELKQALRSRIARGPVAPSEAERIAAVLRAATQQMESIMTTQTPATGGLKSVATVATPKAAGYAAQLAKHFAHKIPARFEDGAGEITFPAGTCQLAAADGILTMTVAGATPEAVAQLEDVVARHLLRFAFREELAIDWHPAGDAPAA